MFVGWPTNFGLVMTYAYLLRLFRLKLLCVLEILRKEEDFGVQLGVWIC